MIILNSTEIESLIDYPCAIGAVESAYRAVSESKVNLPPVGHITFPEHDGDCHIKYGHILGCPTFVIKIATGFPYNADLGLPTGNGMSVVMSAETGKVKALLHDEMIMTDIRTGIGGAIASKQFARENSKNALIIGTGVQAQRQIEAHISLFGTDLAFEVQGRSSSKAWSTVNAITGTANIFVAKDLEAACRAADIIVTATASTSPVVMHDWVRPGTHITAVGADAPGKQELESSLVAGADVLAADFAAQCLDHGEFAIPYLNGLIDPEKVVDLGDVLGGNMTGRTSDTDITIVDQTGIAAQDIAIADVVLSAYEAKNHSVN